MKLFVVTLLTEEDGFGIELSEQKVFTQFEEMKKFVDESREEYVKETLGLKKEEVFFEDLHQDEHGYIKFGNSYGTSTKIEDEDGDNSAEWVVETFNIYYIV